MRITFRIILVLLVLLSAYLITVERRQHPDAAPDPTPEARQAAALEQARRLEAQARRNMTEHPDGGHCLDPVTGAHPGVLAYVGARPGVASVQHLQTDMTPVNTHGEHLLTMRYRTSNARGETRERSERFVVQNGNCVFER